MEDLGIVVGGPLATIEALAARAEQAGFAAAWLHEAGHDAMVAATLVARATSRIRIGTDVAVAFARSPTLAAFSAWDLQEASGGRFLLGLGSQVRAIVEEGFAAAFHPPAARMAEYLQVVRATIATLRGTPTTFEGSYYRVTRPAPYAEVDPERPAPPVLLAAVGPMMTAAAARHADGVVGHPFTTRAFVKDRLHPRIEGALAEAGRDRADFLMTTGLIVEVDDDREAARRRARAQVAFYGTTPNYREVFEVNGDGSLLDDARAAMRAGGLTALHEAVPDSRLDAYAVAGTSNEVRDGLAAWRGLADNLVLTPVRVGRDGADLVAATERLIDAVAGQSLDA